MKLECKADLAELSTEDLLKLYNDKTGKATKKFSSRAKGEAQVWAILAREKAANAGPVAKTKGKDKAARVGAGVGRGGRKLDMSYELVKEDLQPPRANTKRAFVRDMLMKKAATLEEVAAAVNEAFDKGQRWGRKTAYEGVRLLHVRHGYGLEMVGEDKVKCVG